MRTLSSYLWRSAALVAVSAGLVGCSGSGYVEVVVPPDPIRTVWYDVYGNACGYDTPRPQCNFYSERKYVYDKYGDPYSEKISAADDPYYPGDFFWDGDDYGGVLKYRLWEYTNAYGDAEYWEGWGWLSGNGILYTDDGFALNEEGQSESRNVLAEAAKENERGVKVAAQGLIDRYALSEEAAENIARVTNGWARLGKSRARTAQDKAEYLNKIYGVSVERGLAAAVKAKQGDPTALTELNKEVAENWGVDAETSVEIMKKWYKLELAQAGVK